MSALQRGCWGRTVAWPRLGRRALLFYALRRLGLDVAADVRPANEQHIVLVNRAEVAAARMQVPQA